MYILKLFFLHPITIKQIYKGKNQTIMLVYENKYVFLEENFKDF